MTQHQKPSLAYTKTLLKALPAYFGGKRKLISTIFDTIQDDDGDVVIDPMGGSMTIPLTAKHQGFTVIANDRSPGAVLIAKGLLENNTHTIDLAKLPLFITTSANDRFIEITYGDWHLPKQLAIYADNIYGHIVQLPTAEQPIYQLMLYRFLTLMAPYNLYRYPGLTKGFLNNTYPASMQKHIDRWNTNIANPLPQLEKIAKQLNDAVSTGIGRICSMEVFDFLDKAAGDILYLDPPYAGAGIPYEDGYRVINSMITRKPDVTPISEFNNVKVERDVLKKLITYGLEYNLTLFSYWTELHDRAWFEQLFDECGFTYTEVDLGNYSYSYSTKVGKKGEWDQQKSKGQKEILYALRPKTPKP